ncbi:MAG: DUF4172 domain-containing protein [Chlamydiales bacterium]|nr:DUF4172 domain-containing protein [Chlamydiales bacterium]
MPWNWKLPGWPKFSCDFNQIAQRERQFLLSVGTSAAFLKNISEQEYNQFIVEILSSEGLESSKIEGELLDRESLQSSIKRHFGLCTTLKESDKESRMAELLCSVYESLNLLYFLINKSKMLTKLSGKINPRQEKVLLRMFAEGPSGFKGGLSAENYIAITKSSRSTLQLHVI